jgi:(2Fe-2S) ferredoxin
MEVRIVEVPYLESDKEGTIYEFLHKTNVHNIAKTVVRDDAVYSNSKTHFVTSDPMPMMNSEWSYCW